MNHLPSSGPLSITVSTTADHTHVCIIGGEIDGVTAPAFEQVLLGSLGAGGSTVVDLREVSFFGVAGIRALLTAQDFANRRHCAMCIDGSYCVTRILDVTGVAGQFDLGAPRLSNRLSNNGRSRSRP
ncbi:STAS domain-containing protein [Nocardia sp. NPDC051981]|uniref:STAS domain-containing protein n=1 Tax=Nocardia sp. NPDC051981 TaxID=3155417 RepID=UPI00342857E1